MLGINKSKTQFQGVFISSAASLYNVTHSVRLTGRILYNSQSLLAPLVSSATIQSRSNYLKIIDENTKPKPHDYWEEKPNVSPGFLTLNIVWFLLHGRLHPSCLSTALFHCQTQVLHLCYLPEYITIHTFLSGHGMSWPCSYIIASSRLYHSNQFPVIAYYLPWWRSRVFSFMYLVLSS